MGTHTQKHTASNVCACVCMRVWLTHTHTHAQSLLMKRIPLHSCCCLRILWLAFYFGTFCEINFRSGTGPGQASDCNWPEYRGNAPTTHTQTHPPIPAHLGECINYVYLNYKQAVLWQRRDKYTPGHSRYWPLPDQLPAGYGPCDAFVACASQATRTASLARIFTKDLCQKLISWKNVLFLAHSVCRCV